MDRFSSTLALALVSTAFLNQSALAAASCTTGGVSYFGTEVFASQPPDGSGQYLYQIANLQCSGGKVIKWLDSSAWYTPDQMLETLKSSNANMKRVFTNDCKTHAILLHDNFTGSVDGVSARNFAVAKQTHYGVFAGPVFYNRPAELLCPDVPGVGAPDLPGACPVPSAPPLLAGQGSPSLSAGNPVDVAYGNKFQTEIDYSGRSGSEMRFIRYYNSRTTSWTHTYAARLKLSPTKALLIDADGRQSLFSVSGTTVAASPKELGRLEKTTQGWRYDSPRNEHLHFDSAGQLTRIDRANGTYEILSYSANAIVVTDSLGHAMTLTFNAAQRLATLMVDDLQVSYTYSTAGRLTKATRTQNGQALSRTYHYEDAREGGWLTGITDERGVRYATWTYDAQGRATKSEHAGGADRYQFAYGSNSTTLTNPLGKKATYSFQTIAGAKRITSLSGAASANCPSSNSTFTYDSRGLIKTRTDNKGNQTTFIYNDRGLEISRTEAAGTPQARTIITEWHPTLFRPVTITEPERIVQFNYDAHGNPLSQTLTER
ncbi:MAG: RHS repeat protein [Alphaproteobacteria bacterium]|nr:RHS repeat protein [Alphaproteobacteria bacterium]MBU2326953.1 RHS repeat protein [Alphaproteobacteria bacterium]